MVSARPETIWLARSVITRNAWIDASAAPAIAATTTAAVSDTRPVTWKRWTRPEAHHSADEHHPLDAEVEHARALGEQLAERGVEQRRSVRDTGGDQDDEQRVVHAAVRLRSTLLRADDAHAMADQHLAAEGAEEDDPLDHADEAGREISPCRVFPAFSRPPIRNATRTTANGLYRASAAMTIPV